MPQANNALIILPLLFFLLLTSPDVDRPILLVLYEVFRSIKDVAYMDKQEVCTTVSQSPFQSPLSLTFLFLGLSFEVTFHVVADGNQIVFHQLFVQLICFFLCLS
jgi:hypothetical protein